MVVNQMAAEDLHIVHVAYEWILGSAGSKTRNTPSGYPTYQTSGGGGGLGGGYPLVQHAEQCRRICKPFSKPVMQNGAPSARSTTSSPFRQLPNAARATTQMSQCE